MTILQSPGSVLREMIYGARKMFQDSHPEHLYPNVIYMTDGMEQLLQHQFHQDDPQARADGLSIRDRFKTYFDMQIVWDATEFSLVRSTCSPSSSEPKPSAIEETTPASSSCCGGSCKSPQPIG